MTDRQIKATLHAAALDQGRETDRERERAEGKTKTRPWCLRIFAASHVHFSVCAFWLRISVAT